MYYYYYYDFLGSSSRQEALYLIFFSNLNKSLNNKKEKCEDTGMTCCTKAKNYGGLPVSNARLFLFLCRKPDSKSASQSQQQQQGQQQQQQQSGGNRKTNCRSPPTDCQISNGTSTASLALEVNNTSYMLFNPRFHQLVYIVEKIERIEQAVGVPHCK